jgi:alpha-tubulin suppressor-like RCC1 family protein
MRSTRRLLDRTSFSALVLLTACGAAASCSSPDDGSPPGLADAGPEASTSADGGAPSEAGLLDVTVRDVTPPPFDGGPLPVVCTSDPCATSLVTTLALNASDPSEGYCALLRDGTVACWGANGAGQLGRGDSAGTSDHPTAGRVAGLSDIEELNHTCAVDKSGGVWCWGTGPYLRNDAGAPTTERTPIKLPLPPVRHVGVGMDVACASNDDGVLCWGSNANGQLAPLTTTPASTLLPPRPIDLPSGTPIREVLVGEASFALLEDGVTLSWGASAPLGRDSSLGPDPYPLAIPVAGISSIDLTRDNACATASGIGYCWGRLLYLVNDWGFVTGVDQTVPEPVQAPEPLVQIATTRAWAERKFGTPTLRPHRWCAVGALGSVYCWGFNESGQAGDGTKKHAYQAVRVEGLPTTAAQVKTMPDSTCALLTNGKVYCWGSNYYGQLGNGKLRIPSLVPKEVVLP